MAARTVHRMADQRRHNQSDRIALRLPARLVAALDEAARDDDRTRSEFVRELLRRELLPPRAQREHAT